MRSRIRSVVSVLAVTASSLLGLVVLPLLVAAPATAGPPPGQVITVQSGASWATTARFDLWQLSATGGYTHVLGPVGAYVGELGIGQTRDNVARTPAGIFGLTQAFGNQPTLGTKLPYFQAGPSDWWDGEAGTPAYNTHVHQVASPGPGSENLYYAGPVYAHAVVIDYNRFPVVSGAGSAFFLHVTNGQPTAGCVAISSYVMSIVQRWLNPALHPVISIGVGSAATRLVDNQNAAAARYNPRGHLDSVTVSGRTAQLTGWAVDPEGPSSKLPVDIYVDNVFRGRFSTGTPRPDVARVIRAGPNQGFVAAVTGLAPGTHKFCAYAINIGLGTTNPSLGCLAATVR